MGGLMLLKFAAGRRESRPLRGPADEALPNIRMLFAGRGVSLPRRVAFAGRPVRRG